MNPIYLLAIVRKRRDHDSKMTRIAKCSFDQNAKHGRQKIGEFWRLDVYQNPVPSMLEGVFIGHRIDPGVRAAEVLAYRLESGLSLASGVRWEEEVHEPIDADYAVSKRIELEVV